jgi:2-keto-4-pentenoate hydratase
VLPDGLHTDAGELTLELARFCQPKLEAEVGLVLDGSAEPQVTACVEIADCRFAGWRPPPGVAVADFGLQGAMVFGPGRPAPARSASRCGTTVARSPPPGRRWPT